MSLDEGKAARTGGQEDSSEWGGGADLVSKAWSDLDSAWQEKGSLTSDDC